jgi:leucyl aminopeptidase (aminopeptidase T)
MTERALPAAMITAARRAMAAVLDLTADDRVLVLGDDTTGRCPAAFAAAAREVGCDVAEFMLPAAERPHTRLPAGLVDLLDGVTVVVNVLDGRSDEVPFRIEWIKAIEATGRIRMGHCPGITEAMMTGGSLDVDYAVMTAREQRLLAALDGAESLHITTPGGTDLTLGVAGRTFVSDLKATVDTGCNLPCGEVYCAPVEDGADGVLVVDGPVGGDGNPPAPIRITVIEGRVTEVACADPDWQAMVQGYMDTDENSCVICELGIGLNPGARLAGRMLEDEKALRTAHIAFGSNEGMPGGQSISRMHIDYLFHRPTIALVAEDGTETALLADGELVG